MSPYNSTPIFSNEKVVACVIGDELVKKVFASRHFLQRPPSIAFDVDVLRQAEAAGATRITVIDKETDDVYRATFQLIRTEGILFDYGCGPQIRLALSKWSLNDDTLAGLTDQPKKPKTQPPGAVQMGLFEVPRE